jgi:ABC-type glycerol-3-phosphate transport system substrate-binding protein
MKKIKTLIIVVAIALGLLAAPSLGLTQAEEITTVSTLSDPGGGNP